MALVPFLRACARSLTSHRAEADDLVQEAMLKAWAKRDSYQPGTSLKAWTATILRNYFRQTRRRSWRESALDPDVAAQVLVAVDDPGSPTDLDEVRRALQMLPLSQREVLILLAGGLSYDEVAEICGCAQGTVKSRASRGRAALQTIVDEGAVWKDGIAPSEAADRINRQVVELSARARAAP